MTNDDLSKLLKLGYPVSTQPHTCGFCLQVMEMPLIHIAHSGEKLYGHPCSSTIPKNGTYRLRFS